MGSSRYGRVAGLYETLAKLYSWGSILKAREVALGLAAAGSDALLLGVGAGAELKNSCIECRSLDVIDLSESMLAQAQHALALRRKSHPAVTLMVGDFWAQQGQYDCIVCPFFLNVFRRNKIPQVQTKLINLLKASPSSRLIIADFSAYQSKKLTWSKALQWLYYTPPRLLFACLTRNPWHALYDYPQLFSEHFEVIHRKQIDRFGLFEVLILRLNSGTSAL